MTEDGEAQGLRIIAENVYDLATMRKRYAKGLSIACNGNASADRLAEILQPFRPGDTPITVALPQRARRRRLELPEAGASTSTMR